MSKQNSAPGAYLHHELLTQGTTLDSVAWNGATVAMLVSVTALLALLAL